MNDMAKVGEIDKKRKTESNGGLARLLDIAFVPTSYMRKLRKFAKSSGREMTLSHYAVAGVWELVRLSAYAGSAYLWCDTISRL